MSENVEPIFTGFRSPLPSSAGLRLHSLFCVEFCVHFASAFGPSYAASHVGMQIANRFNIITPFSRKTNQKSR